MDSRSTAVAQEVVVELSAIVRASPQELMWQRRYANTSELESDLHDHAERLRNGDDSRLSDLRFLLLPTGPLCEIAASSGWLERYTSLANRFDEAYG